MSIQVSQSGAIIATGEGVSVFAMLTLKSALSMYDKHKMKVNRMYTPTNMLATASKFTGQTFKRGQFKEAIAALQTAINQTRANELNVMLDEYRAGFIQRFGDLDTDVYVKCWAEDWLTLNPRQTSYVKFDESTNKFAPL